MPLGVHFLRWADVDPARHDFDPSLARSVAVEVIGAAVRGDLHRNRSGDVRRDRLQWELSAGLVAACGTWVLGWNWAASEPGGGGPIRSWCCASHSVFAHGDAGAMPTIDRVVAAVTEWHELLESLDALYRELRASTDGFDLPRRTEHAASRLIALVAERTGAEDAWYRTFSLLLRWFLELCGHDEVAEEAIDRVIRGHFGSWIEPNPSTVAVVVEDLQAAVQQRPAISDSLSSWLNVRETVVAPHALDMVHRPVIRDAHRSFIEARDRTRDPVRADRMTAALDACRASARQGEPLSFALLASWQQRVLGLDAPPSWRTADAFARHVRYAYSPDLPARFDAAISEANGPDPVEVRAVRAYLDVCFFHPFADGNARAARLALDYILTREGLGLHAIDPLIMIARSTDDAFGVVTMANMLRLLAGPLRAGTMT